MDKTAWKTRVHGVTKSESRLSTITSGPDKGKNLTVVEGWTYFLHADFLQLQELGG